MTQVSVVILCKNEERYIGETLQAVLDQGEVPCEVLVIDAGSRDRSVQIVQQYPVTLLRIGPHAFGHGRTRNLGARLATGEFVVFLNGDATPTDKGWLSGLISGFTGEGIAGVYSRIYPRPGCNPLDARSIVDDRYLFNGKVKDLRAFPDYFSLSPEKKRRVSSFHTVSCAIRRGVLLHQPFADIAFGEDLEWSKRMIEAGLSIVYASDSAVWHSHDTGASLSTSLQRSFDDARACQKIFRRWSVRRLCGWAAVSARAVISDLRYIAGLERSLLYKLRWMVRSPFVRAAQYLGILLGCAPFLPRRAAEALSLVARRKKG